jgi:hypothetical protein
MAEEANVISINGNEYEESALSDVQKKYIYHIRDLQQKISVRKLELEPLEVALEHYTNTLIKEIESENDNG